jgi:hypothetical protein
MACLPGSMGSENAIHEYQYEEAILQIFTR